MAQKIVFSSGSAFAGNPIIFEVTADNISGNVSFHIVYLEVTIAPSSGPDISEKTYLLTNTVGSDLKTYFDVSSVVRLALCRSAYKPIDSESHNSSYAAYRVRAWDEYMKDGILHENVGTVTVVKNWYGLMGEFTNSERSGNETLAISRLTDKPASGEICASSEVYVSPLPLSTNITPMEPPVAEPSSKAYSLSGHNGEYVEIDGRRIYVIDNRDLVQIQFVNRFGMLESISAHRILSIDISADSTTYKASSGIGFGDISVNKTIHRNKVTDINCSTGYISREWADWWQENLFAESLFKDCMRSNTQWVKIDGNWVPCAIIFNESTYKSDDLIYIDFIIRV